MEPFYTKVRYVNLGSHVRCWFVYNGGATLMPRTHAPPNPSDRYLFSMDSLYTYITTIFGLVRSHNVKINSQFTFFDRHIYQVPNYYLSKIFFH